MISMEQISGEIAALEEEKPTHSVMQKLAALYTVRDHMVLAAQPAPASAIVSETIPDTGINSGEFLQAISGMEIKELLPILEDLMSTLQVVQPRLYDGVMRKVKDLTS